MHCFLSYSLQFTVIKNNLSGKISKCEIYYKTITHSNQNLRINYIIYSIQNWEDYFSLKKDNLRYHKKIECEKLKFFYFKISSQPTNILQNEEINAKLKKQVRNKHTRA